jgi:YD repeat-containing protein
MQNLINRPFSRLDSLGNTDINLFSDEAFRGEYSGDNLIYKGFARPGSSTDRPVWQIAFLTYDGSGNVLTITWPRKLIAGVSSGPASNDYEFIWDDRASLSYA